MQKPDQDEFDFSFQEEARLLSVEEIYAANDPVALRSILEDDRVERKPAGIHARALSIWFSMWSNTAPHGGIIAVGISDDGQFEGIGKVGMQHVNDLARTGDNYCPDAKYDYKRLRVTNVKGKEDEILLIRVRYNDKKVVKTSDGMAYLRRGSSKRELTDDEINELRIEKNEISLEREDSVLPYPDSFDAKAISEFARSVIEKRKLEHTKTSEEILVHRRLGRMADGKFIPNKACTILFAIDPRLEIPGCKIRFLRFDGKQEGQGEKWNAVKDDEFEGPLPDQIIAVEKAIESQLREFSKMGRFGKFVTTPEYPKLAWYEGIVNACCHRSYSLKNAHTVVKMFDDRLEIESPGGFMPLVTPDNIYECHHARNPHLMEAMYFLDFVKCAHEGTRRMRQTMADLELPPPQFSEKHAAQLYFRVILKNNVEHRKIWLDADASRVVGEAIFGTLSEYEKRAINHAAEFKKINISDTMRLTGRNWHTSRNLLNGLVEKRILSHVHNDTDRDTKAYYVLHTPTEKKSGGR